MMTPFLPRPTPRRTHGLSGLATFATLAIVAASTVAPPTLAAPPPHPGHVLAEPTAPPPTVPANSRLARHLGSPLRDLQAVEAPAFALDPAKLSSRTDADLRGYFAGGPVDSPTTLGIKTRLAARIAPDATPSTANPANPANPEPAPGLDAALLVPRTPTSPGTDLPDPVARMVRTETAPLRPEDFVELGRVADGTRLDFFILARGASRGTTAYSAKASLNADAIDHVASFAYGLKDSPYLLLSYEDLYANGDDDLDDLLFALDLGNINIAALTATPEPSTYLMLGTLIALGAMLKRRADAARAATATLTP